MKSLRIHCFQHVEYEDLGCIKNWCDDNRHNLSYTKFYAGDPVPQTVNFDWLIIMGGPMGVYDEDKYTWLSDEKNTIKKAVAENKTVIGICLGSQLLAEALGAKVFRNPEKEIGWFDIILTEQGKEIALFNGIENRFKVFHWHGDTYDIPASCRHIAYTEACKNQAFVCNNNILGLQFHFEVTERSIKNMIEKGRNELTGKKFIQTESQILTFTKYIKGNNNAMFRILDNLVKMNY